MNEQRPDGLTPAQSEAVRRLLAGARHDEGIPDDVAARLDATIADLAADQSADLAAGRADSPAPAPAARPASRPANVIPLRRRWPKVLVAAAAVTLIGYGGAQLVGNGANLGDAGGGIDETSEREADSPVTGESFDSSGLAPGTATPNAPQPEDNAAGGLTDGMRTLNSDTLSKLGLNQLARLRAGALDEDLAALQARRSNPVETNGQQYSAGQVGGLQCGPFYTVSGGETFAAKYRRHVALVLFHPALDGVRLVEIYDCQSKAPRRTVRTVTLQTGE